MSPRHYFLVFLVMSLMYPHSIHGLAIKSTAKKLGMTVGKAARFGFALPLLKIKKAIILAPLALPLAVGAKVATLGALAIPATLGAAIGAPIGAVVGAKIGAVKGAIIGKKLLALKLLLALKGLKIAGAIAAKPFILLAGAKAAIIAKKAALLGKGAALMGKAVAVSGKAITVGGAKLTGLSAKVNSVGAMVGDKISETVSGFSIPVIPAPAPIVLAKPAVIKTGPFTIDVQYAVDTPMTGPRFGKAYIYGNRKKRQATSDFLALPESPQDINKLLQFVKDSNGETCLARVICELSSNPNAHGREGLEFGTTLLSMSRTTHEGAQEYRAASSTGTKLRNPSQCTKHFECNIPSAEVIKIGNNILNG